MDAQEFEMRETVQVYEFKTSQGNITRTLPSQKRRGWGGEDKIMELIPNYKAELQVPL